MQKKAKQREFNLVHIFEQIVNAVCYLHARSIRYMVTQKYHLLILEMQNAFMRILLPVEHCVVYPQK